ncbi:hypothetical protein [Geminisphaera colitermitum]|uniref:hypothetical protein n=1 Tax=Geminisphaera colitermitum TaxID=1148786 RepID=UPI0012FEA44B|nr:hypothetical protein [Geminisphaera colitermitum]
MTLTFASGAAVPGTAGILPADDAKRRWVGIKSGAGVLPASEQNAGGTPAPLCHQHDAGRMPALPGAAAPL